MYQSSEEGRENGDGKEERVTWFLCDKSEEDLTVIMGYFLQMCRRGGLKVNTGKRKVMVLNRGRIGMRGSC